VSKFTPKKFYEIGSKLQEHFRANLFTLFNKLGLINDTLQNDTEQNDTQHNDTQHYDTQHNDTQHNATQHIGTQHNDIQHKGFIIHTHYK
jgi:hypothetical protein